MRGNCRAGCREPSAGEGSYGKEMEREMAVRARWELC